MRPFVASLLLATCASAHGAPTELSEYLVLERTDLAVAGLGGMGAPGSAGGGAGEIVLEGVQGEVTLALLYWNGIDIDKPADGFTGGDHDYDEAQVVFDGTPVTGTRVASGGNNNGWPFSGNDGDSAATYRADVTDLVDGNGTYTLAGFSDGAGHSTNGVSLIVYFDDGELANDRHVSHLEGQLSTLERNPSGWYFWLAPDIAGGQVEAIAHVADGQTVHTHGSLNFDAWPGLRPEESRSVDFDSPHEGIPLFAGESVPKAGFPRSSSGQGLWDIQRFDVSTLFDVPREYAVRVDYGGGTDALSLLVLQILQPAAPLPWLDPVDHRFADVPEDTVGPAHRFTFSNHFPTPVEMLSTSANSRFPIVADGCSGTTVPGGGSCAIDVACAPTAVVEYYEELHVDWQRAGDTDIQRNNASLRCAGAPPGPVARIDIEPRQHWFGVQTNGSTGAPHRFTVTSVGELPLTVDSVQTTTTTASLRFKVAAETCTGRLLQPSQSCTVDVVFDPLESTSTAPRRAVLRLRIDSDGTEYPVYDVPLGGLGLPDTSRIFRDGFEGI